MSAATFKDLCIDAVDAPRLGRFWSDVLGLELRRRERDGMTQLVGPSDRHTVWVNQVPEPVSVKQWVHLDVDTPDRELLVGDGARVLRAPDDDISWTVLADPEGNEVCAFVG